MGPISNHLQRFKPDNASSYITSLDFDDTGELAITCRTDDTLQIYNCKQAQHAKELFSKKYGAHLARFTHQSSSVIYASTKVNNDIRYLSTHDNSYISYFKGHEGLVTSLTMCPGKDEFASCAEDNTLRLWDIKSPNARGWLKLLGISLVTYDPTSSVVAATSVLTQEVLLYDLRNFDKAPFATFDCRGYDKHFNRGAETPSWNRLEFSNDGKHILVGTGAGGHYILDSFDGELKYFCRRPALSQRKAPGAQASLRVAGQGDVSFSPDGKFLIGGSGTDEGISVWDLTQPVPADKVLKPAHTLPFPPKIKDRAEICVYNPRFHQVVTADQDTYMWYPDNELYTPV